MEKVIAYVLIFSVIIVWIAWRIISVKIPYLAEQIIQYSLLVINGFLLLFTYRYWNIICFIIVLAQLIFSLRINTETGVNLFAKWESEIERLYERRMYLKAIDDILMDINIVALFIQLVLIFLYISKGEAPGL